MLIFDNPVSIIIQINFKYKKQNIIKVNSDIVTCDVALPCMMLAGGGGQGKRKEIDFFLFFHSVEGRKKACTGLQEEKLINRLEVILYQQELDNSS